MSTVLRHVSRRAWVLYGSREYVSSIGSTCEPNATILKHIALSSALYPMDCKPTEYSEEVQKFIRHSDSPLFVPTTMRLPPSGKVTV